MLTTYHNLYWLENFMKNVRESVKEGRFMEFKTDFLKRFKAGEN
jgi:queuine tRNA-ribosyltransferase